MLKRFFKDTQKYYGYSVIAARAQLKREVADSYLNWIWWILDPLCFMLIYAFIFGYVFQAREPFFAVFIFIGLTLWTFFSKTLSQSVRIIKANKPIVSKVYFPKFILILIKIWNNGFKLLVSFAIIVLMMLFYRVPLSWNVFWIFPILLTLAVFTFACSCFLLHYGVYVADLANVINIVLRFFFYLSGIFYNIESRVPTYGALFNRANPMAFLITSARQCLIYEQTPDWKLLLFWLVFSILLSMAGIRKIYKEENSYVKSI